MKSTVEQIRSRFDQDVERFSNLETGQSATIDAPLVLELVTRAALAATPHPVDLLDIGCGAGNYSLKMLGLFPGLNITLLDLSKPMLERAVQRLTPVSSGILTPVQTDIRDFDGADSRFDIILAAAVFHHLRGEEEWRAVFSRCYAMLRSGGSIWISDLIEHSTPDIQSLMRDRYSEYLVSLKGDQYRKQVFDYIELEDTPRSLIFQLDLLRSVGFERVEILHKNILFAAFGAIKG